MKKGFTLIELLVVISIIGLLSSVVLAALNSVRAKARDVRRLSDIHQIQTALEMYYHDYGRYPTSQGTCLTSTVPNNSWCNSIETYSAGHWIAGGALAPYLPSDPIDPKQPSVPIFDGAGGNASGGTYFYFSWSNTSEHGCGPGQFYLLIGGMEIVSNRKNLFSYCDGVGIGSTYGGTYITGNSLH